MALFSVPQLANVHRVRDAVREIRKLPTGDRTKKQILNEWFDEQEMLRRAERLRLGNARLLRFVLRRSGLPRLVRREILREFRRAGMVPATPITQGVRGRAFDQLLGAQRNSRIMG